VYLRVKPHSPGLVCIGSDPVYIYIHTTKPEAVPRYGQAEVTMDAAGRANCLTFQGCMSWKEKDRVEAVAKSKLKCFLWEGDRIDGWTDAELVHPHRSAPCALDS
jgi:hypothetical protein